jgi:hypothetical protein
MDLRDKMGGRGLDQSVSKQRQVAGSCKYGDKTLGFIGCGILLD